MGVDYMIELDCTAKQVLSSEGIVGALKARSRAEMVLGMMRQQGDNRPASELTFQTVLMRPEGPTTANVSVQSLFDQAAALDAHAPQCLTCPARARAQEFGCWGYISYPVRPETEEWLMSRLPVDLKSIGGHLLKSAVNDFGWDGSYTAGLRRQGDTFFVSKQPLSRKWGGFFSRFTLTSDQLWQMMFGLGPLQPTHMEMLCVFLGYPSHAQMLSGLPEAQDRDRLLAVIRDNPLTVPPDAPPQLTELAAFITSMAVAATMGLQISVDG